MRLPILLPFCQGNLLPCAQFLETVLSGVYLYLIKNSENYVLGNDTLLSQVLVFDYLPERTKTTWLSGHGIVLKCQIICLADLLLATGSNSQVLSYRQARDVIQVLQEARHVGQRVISLKAPKPPPPCTPTNTRTPHALWPEAACACSGKHLSPLR